MHFNLTTFLVVCIVLLTYLKEGKSLALTKHRDRQGINDRQGKYIASFSLINSK